MITKITILVSLLLIQTYAQGAVQVSFNQLDSPVSALHWCGASIVFTKDDEAIEQTHAETRKVLFSLTDDGTVWRSNDYGQNWVNENQNYFQPQLDNKNLTFESIQISPADSRVIYFFGAEGVSFKSSNCGRTYQKFTHQDTLYDFKLNKMDHKWIMAFRDKPCAKKDINCKEYYKKSIYVTSDGGDTWKSALNYVRDASWDKLLQYQMIPDQRIIACHIKDGKSVISFSDDFFETVEVMQDKAMGFFQTQFYIFVLTQESQEQEDAEGFQLLIAPAYLDRFVPQEIKLPIQNINQHSFTILDTSEGQIFVSVSHQEQNQRLTNIYVSDFRGFKFTLSLLHNVRSLDTGNCDFERMLGIEGVYIANVYDHSEVERIKGRDYIDASHLDSYKKSGGNWHAMKAPELDHKGEELQCAGDCSLHLKGRTEANQNPIYSSENSPGIAMGVGNTGLYLSQKDHELNTYLTRDGGHSWFEIRNGSHMYEIGDRGGLIVMARDSSPTNQILYSWDEGLNWDFINFSNVSIEISNIVTEPSNMEQKFVVYGQSPAAVDGKLKGYVVGVNFQTLHQRVCSGSWDPTMPESDYEFWIPKNYEDGKCLFGRKMKYIRRKREAKCFNQEENDKKFFIETCPCVEDDWECDYGFFRKIEGGLCVPIAQQFEEDDMPDLLKPPVDCRGTYTITQGYRKVSGDYCQGGVDLGPKEMPCPEAKNNTQEEEETVVPPPPPRARLSEPTEFTQVDTPTSGKGSIQNNLWTIVLVLILIIVGLLFKDSILGQFMKNYNMKYNSLLNKKKPSLDKYGQPIKMQGIKRGNYEQISLFQNDDEAGM